MKLASSRARPVTDEAGHRILAADRHELPPLAGLVLLAYAPSFGCVVAAAIVGTASRYAQRIVAR